MFCPISFLKNTENTSSTSEVFKICNPPFPKDENARPYSKIKEEDEESFISFLKRHVCYDNNRLTEYFKQIKRRLYTKDKEHYSYWSELGESNENWYWVDNQWKKYVNGKIVK